MFVSRAFERAFGVSRDEILGRRPDELERFFGSSGELNPTGMRMQTGVRIDEPVKMRTSDGRVIECRVSGGPLKIGDGLVIVAIMTGPAEIVARR